MEEAGGDDWVSLKQPEQAPNRGNMYNNRYPENRDNEPPKVTRNLLIERMQIVTNRL